MTREKGYNPTTRIKAATRQFRGNELKPGLFLQMMKIIQSMTTSTNVLYRIITYEKFFKMFLKANKKNKISI